MQRLLILLFLLLATALKTFAYYETALLLRLPGQQFFIFLKTSPKEKMHFFLNNTLEKRATGQKTGLNYLSYGLQNLFIPQTIPPGKGGDPSALWRYELATGTKQNITNFGEVRRGKNGKMYVSVQNNQNLKEVSAPDGSYTVANFTATNINGEKLVGVLPLQPNRTLPETEDSLYARELGKRVYSLNDHLLSTRILLSDRKLSTISGGVPTAFTGDILEYYNYAPGGFSQVGRKKQSASPYRFTYGSHERIDEVLGNENTVDMGDRWLDTRIMRTPKPDQLTAKYPGISPYAAFGNNPVYFIDIDGRDATGYIGSDGKLYIQATYYAVSEGKQSYTDVERKTLESKLNGFWSQAAGMTVTLSDGRTVEIGKVEINVNPGGDFQNTVNKVGAEEGANALLKGSSKQIQDMGSGDNTQAVSTKIGGSETFNTSILDQDKTNKFAVGDEQKKIDNAFIDESGHILGTKHPKKLPEESNKDFRKRTESEFGQLERGNISATGALKLSNQDLQNVVKSQEFKLIEKPEGEK